MTDSSRVTPPGPLPPPGPLAGCWAVGQVGGAFHILSPLNLPRACKVGARSRNPPAPHHRTGRAQPGCPRLTPPTVRHSLTGPRADPIRSGAPTDQSLLPTQAMSIREQIGHPDYILEETNRRLDEEYSNVRPQPQP